MFGFVTKHSLTDCQEELAEHSMADDNKLQFTLYMCLTCELKKGVCILPFVRLLNRHYGNREQKGKITAISY